jgi:hypothetical protein
MALVKVEWIDAADNETGFKVYRGTNSAVATSDVLIAEVSLSSGNWTVTGQSGSSHQLTSVNTGASSATGETFTLTYEESNAGTYFYGVAATNSVGDSPITSSTITVTVS